MSRSIVILAVFAAVCLIEAEGLKMPSGKGIRAKIGHAREDSKLFVTSAEVSQRENIEKNAKGLLFMPKIESETLIQSVLAGATVSLAMIPEAVSFAFVAGVSPLVALWSTVLLGFTAAAFGGRPGVMSGASGACSVVIAALVASHGSAYLSACVILAGLLQAAAGVLGLGKFIRLVPHPVMLGFVNGLAVVMTRAQLSHFRDAGGAFLMGSQGYLMWGLTALTMALIQMIPKVTKKLPPSLGSIFIVTAITKIFKLPAVTLASIAGADTFTGGLSVLPKLGLPAVPFSMATLKTIFPYAGVMAAVGLIESLLTVQLVDGLLDDGKKGSTKMECIGQGAGNIASGLFGGQGGCALVGQSIINVESGGANRIAGMAMASLLGIGIVAAAPLLGSVPIASLVGTMLLVCKQTFAWSSLRLVGRVPNIDIAIILAVSYITVVKDLAVAVGMGTVMSALNFAWKQSVTITSRESVDATSGWKRYAMDGPLFFGSTGKFGDLFSPKDDPEDVIIDFGASRVYDQSALVAINTLCEKYGAMGKKVHLQHLSRDCGELLKQAAGGELPPYELLEADSSSDPVYSPAVERNA